MTAGKVDNSRKQDGKERAFMNAPARIFQITGHTGADGDAGDRREEDGENAPEIHAVAEVGGQSRCLDIAPTTGEEGEQSRYQCSQNEVLYLDGKIGANEGDGTEKERDQCGEHAGIDAAEKGDPLQRLQ